MPLPAPHQPPPLGDDLKPPSRRGRSRYPLPLPAQYHGDHRANALTSRIIARSAMRELIAVGIVPHLQPRLRGWRLVAWSLSRLSAIIFIIVSLAYQIPLIASLLGFQLPPSLFLPWPAWGNYVYALILLSIALWAAGMLADWRPRPHYLQRMLTREKGQQTWGRSDPVLAQFHTDLYMAGLRFTDLVQLDAARNTFIHRQLNLFDRISGCLSLCTIALWITLALIRNARSSPEWMMLDTLHAIIAIGSVAILTTRSTSPALESSLTQTANNRFQRLSEINSTHIASIIHDDRRFGPGMGCLFRLSSYASGIAALFTGNFQLFFLMLHRIARSMWLILVILAWLAMVFGSLIAIFENTPLRLGLYVVTYALIAVTIPAILRWRQTLRADRLAALRGFRELREEGDILWVDYVQSLQDKAD